MAARQLAGHLVITHDRVIAYYRLPLQRWSFRPESERTALVANAAARLAQLTGRRCHLRITSRPFDGWQWASALDASMRGPFDDTGRPSRQVMPGPCQMHPERSQHGCADCVPGLPWLDWLQIQQRRIRQWGITDREVYLGVEVTARSGLRRALGDRWARAAAAERSALTSQAAQVNSAVAGAGLEARPVTEDELQWLLLRSCGLHLPAPLPLREDPAPFPYALPGAAPQYAGEDDLAAYADDFRWSAEPFSRTVQVTRADGRTAHVAVLTLTDMPAGQDLAAESPWIQRTDRLPFPVEWSITFDVLDRRTVQRIMGRQIDKIRAQYSHVVDEHQQEASPLLERQMETARRIQAEADNPESAGTYVWAWPRLAVAGDTPDEALERAGLVAERYSPGITVKQPPDQYKVLREFIPGEPLASVANRRFLHLEFLTAGMPTASAQVGHRDGFPLGVTSSLSCKAVTWQPWRTMELNASGLVTVTGTPGGGKSTLGGKFAYMAVRGGITTAILDPSGMLDELCTIPALRRHAVAANILESPAGTLCPYRLISEPVRARFEFDVAGQRVDPVTAEDRWRRACRAAEVQRRTLTTDILRMLLPPATTTPEDEKALREAVRRAPATLDASPRDVIAELAKLDDFGLGDHAPLVAREIEGIAEHPLARLFFPAAEGDDGLSLSGHLLTVMTLPGLVIPDDDRRPEERTTEEQLSIPVLHLAAQLLRRVLFDLPRSQRKAAVLDEAHALTHDTAGRRLINRMARDSRTNNLLALLISQSPDDLLAAGIANLIGAAFAFRTEGDAEQAATCRLLRLPLGLGYEERLSRLSSAALAAETGHTGECLFFDGYGLEQVQIDLGPDPDLRAALNTNPGAPLLAGRAAVAGGPS
jgi:hypothetical protein